jgi:FAD/FMN-containing dehydrogenase
MSTPADDALSTLRDRTRGDVLLPDADGYEDARRVWNGMIDRRPAVVLRARGAADVMAGVGFAREHGLELSIKGGGHNVAGNAVCDDGLTLDCSALDDVRVDPVRQTARVGPGAVLHDLDVETQAHGLVTPVGFVSETGVAGLTLGGGVGHLSRKHGLTVDNLRSVDLVTAEGRLVRASAEEHPGLFWALRGGGGNFGVVTSFEFDLHPLDPTVLAGPVVWAFEDAPAVLREVAAVVREAPPEVSCLPIVRRAPPAPFLPESVHGELVVLVATIYAGDPAAGERALAPLREFRTPVADAVAPRRYVAFQSMFDAAAETGARNYWKSHYLPALTGEAVDVLCEHAARIPSPESVIGMLSLGGAVSDRPDDATAYPHRDAAWVLNVQSRWRDPTDDRRHVEWTRGLFDAMRPHATGGVYVNFVDGDEGRDRVRAAYGDTTYDRLAAVKAEWDPENVFHLNQNVEPAPARPD